MICLIGSGGGFHEPRASLLAARDYAAFALAYFGAGSLPAEFFEIPLEFIERGLAGLGKHATVASTRLAVYGYSKGGELALLLASLYPQIKAAAAFSGSAFVWQGLHRGRPGMSLPCRFAGRNRLIRLMRSLRAERSNLIPGTKLDCFVGPKAFGLPRNDRLIYSMFLLII